MSFVRVLCLALLMGAVAVTCQVSAAWGEKPEQRYYITIHAAPVEAAKSPPPWIPALVVRLENRFDAGRVIYEQFSLGIANRWSSWLGSELYTTPRQSMPDDGPAVWKEVHGAAVLFSWRRARFSLWNRNTIEWHATDDFVRTRHKGELRLRVFDFMSVYALYELRWDADAERINMQTGATGLLFRVRPGWSLRVLVADEENRRNSARWKSQVYAGLALVVHL